MDMLRLVNQARWLYELRTLAVIAGLFLARPRKQSVAVRPGLPR